MRGVILPLTGERVDVHRLRIDVGQDRRAAGVDDGIHRGTERKRRRDHLVARRSAGREHAQVQGGRAGIDGDGLRHAFVGGEIVARIEQPSGRCPASRSSCWRPPPGSRLPRWRARRRPEMLPCGSFRTWHDAVLCLRHPRTLKSPHAILTERASDDRGPPNAVGPSLSSAPCNARRSVPRMIEARADSRPLTARTAAATCLRPPQAQTRLVPSRSDTHG